MKLDKYSTRIQRVEDIARVELDRSDLADLYEELLPWANSSHLQTDWIGASVEERKQHLRRGCRDVLDQAQKLQGDVTRQIPITGHRKRSRRSVAGGRVNVPALLSGSPLSMYDRRWETQRDARTAIRVFFNATGSCALSTETMLTRGIVLCALAQALSAYRPVELIAYGYWEVSPGSKKGPREQLYLIPLGTRPVDWAMSSAVCHSAFSRDMSFRLGKWLADQRGYSCMPFPDRSDSLPHLRKLLGASERDFIYTSATLGRGRDELCRDPVAWIKTELDKFQSAQQ